MISDENKAEQKVLKKDDSDQNATKNQI